MLPRARMRLRLTPVLLRLTPWTDAIPLITVHVNCVHKLRHQLVAVSRQAEVLWQRQLDVLFEFLASFDPGWRRRGAIGSAGDVFAVGSVAVGARCRGVERAVCRFGCSATAPCRQRIVSTIDICYTTDPVRNSNARNK